ncbi:chromate transporter [Faunimonas pinastri]|uniref:Chromate transporter n=1 Tax=Faunimonas pinastri TaxID=1855383 RepID=A0A1H9K373_9HYPH|nr:chromate transporter [Faunimonas pinastri]SEQ93656.1 chromate transporter [Faunimonas pinastri]
MQNPVWTLIAVFLPLSVVTIGGGQSALAEIQRQTVDVQHWMTSADFVDTFAISRMTPGPGSLIATLIGWKVAGLPGAIAATLALFGPTSFLIYAVAHLWTRYRGARWQVALETGLRPVAAGMILAATNVLIQSMSGGWLARGICLASAAALTFTRVNPVILLALGAATFAAIHPLL